MGKRISAEHFDISAIAPELSRSLLDWWGVNGRKDPALKPWKLEAYFDLCRTSYDDRRNWWPGKSRDHRKHGADAFPWEGASDTESHVIDDLVVVGPTQA